MQREAAGAVAWIFAGVVHVSVSLIAAVVWDVAQRQHPDWIPLRPDVDYGRALLLATVAATAALGWGVFRRRALEAWLWALAAGVVVGAGLQLGDAWALLGGGLVLALAGRSYESGPNTTQKA